MKLSIYQKGSSYFCYKDFNDKNSSFDYKVNKTGGWKGWRWAWSPETVEILNPDNFVVCKLRYQFATFGKTTFNITLIQNNQEFSIDCKLEKKWKDQVYSFTFQNNKYLFHSYRKNYRILYLDNIQVASFDKNFSHFFNRDVFITYAEKEINIPLLIALSIFDDLDKGVDTSTISFEFGNILGTKPPDEKKWRPK